MARFFSDADHQSILDNAASIRGRFEKPIAALVDAIVQKLRAQWYAYCMSAGEPAFRAAAGQRGVRSDDGVTRDDIIEALAPRPLTRDFDTYLAQYGFDGDLAAFEAAPPPPPATPHAMDRDKRASVKEKRRLAKEEAAKQPGAPDAYVLMYYGMQLDMGAFAKQLDLKPPTLNNYLRGKTKGKATREQAMILRNECDQRAASMRQAAEIFQRIADTAQ